MLKIAYSPIYCHDLPANHRFPMMKYELLPEQLIYEGTISESNLFCPNSIHEKYVLKIHDANYVSRLEKLQLTASEIRKIGFPLSEELVNREFLILSGSIEACNYALKCGIAFNIAGGTHHAFTDHGEGFCLLNDIAVSANYLITNQLAKRVLVVDLDVHQGNGTAQIFKNWSNVFTFSMHGASNYPLHKENSDLDFALANGTDDETYLNILKNNLPKVLDQFEPDFIIYQSGVDVLKTDKLGKLALTMEGCKERDYTVLSMARQHQIPLMCCMGGGYSEKINDIIEAHANTYRLAQFLYF
jgi:acetoin utilization deacetylase AcuC-like enzyme